VAFATALRDYWDFAPDEEPTFVTVTLPFVDSTRTLPFETAFVFSV